ncbi:MAG TPA: ferric reductase-like transmembrane domain-containing protein [Candidatus Saccharimonadales bacterium]|nr:ferric reductase-like transmembrane domain-containing protein [Candidatus Saccharimonadales bacterium]
MVFLIHHIRKIVYASAFLWGLFLYCFVSFTIGSQQLQLIRLTEYFALTAISLLYIAVLASPLYSAFPRLPYKPIYIRSRRSIGLSAFSFALIHASLAFFGLLGGFQGLAYLDASYLKAITFSFTALVILTCMAATSFDIMVKKLGTRWKLLHRLVYIAAVLITFHALLLGTHFANLSQTIPKIFFALLSLLLFLESLRFDKFLREKFNFAPTFGLSSLLVIGLLVYSSFYFRSSSGETSSTSLGAHAQHVQIAQQSAQQQSSPLPNLPGLTGDRNKRFTVSLTTSENPTPEEPVTMHFKVYDASTGNPVTVFLRPYQEAYHLIIVDQKLGYFSHLHPQQKNGEFVITTTLPVESTYHLYSDFQPLGAIDQQIATSLTLGDKTNDKPNLTPDKNLTKTFGDYSVTLTSPTPLSASKMSVGQQKLKFTVKDAKSGQPVTDIKPYLGAFGHLVMINSKTYDYLHVHPTSTTPPPPNANGGPDIEFIPIGIYGPFKEGVYQAYFQFNHSGKINLATFVVNVEK